MHQIATYHKVKANKNAAILKLTARHKMSYHVKKDNSIQ